ncbi:hypothetical protein DXA95_14530 [Odoribacter sp. OF09-27XD]|jgi:hypothetical protein|nr:hypothetical protein [Odoribacter sp. OF09-27XD]RHV91005.1 hypothetical protein DXA95_14530 [Odoribacter sp. OF09-27XD]
MSEKKITEASELQYTSPETEYVWKYANEYIPDEFTADDGQILLGESQVPFEFIDKYNDAKPLERPISFDAYLNNDIICTLLDDLKLDKLKFWYLFLFLYDLVSGYCKKGVQIIDSGQQINDFITAFETFVEENPNQKMKLTLKSEYQIGVIKDISTIQYIIKYCKQGLEEESKKRIIQGLQVNEDSNSKFAYLFARQMTLFFQCMNPDREINISDLEKALIVQLIKLTGLADPKFNSKYGKKYLAYDAKNFYNALMNQYKGTVFESCNGSYLI